MTLEAHIHRAARVLWRTGWLLFVGSLGCASKGCLGAELHGEVDGQRFVRCAQAAPPSARELRQGQLSLRIDQRSLAISGAHDLRIAAFTGPVGAALDKLDLEQLSRARPELIFYLGGLGDDEQTARANLTSLAALHIPTLFIAGGADRLPIIEAAFAALADSERETVWHASGLRDVRIGRDRFLIAAGAPLGRYALDDDSCGLDAEDFEQIQAAARASSEPATRSWLLSWYAPAGEGVGTGFGGSELGSPDLKALAAAVGTVGALFAYPEAPPGPGAAASSWLVPRLARVGTQRVDGSRLRRQLVSLVLTDKGLVPTP